MPKRTKNYEFDLHTRLQNPEYAMEYLRAALDDDNEHADAVFLLALRDVAQANHMTYVADATGLNRESLYKMLSRRGNPGINSLKAVLNAVGLKLSVQVATKKQAVSARPLAAWSEPQTVGSFVLVSQLTAIVSTVNLLKDSFCNREDGWAELANPPPLRVERLIFSCICFS